MQNQPLATVALSAIHWFDGTRQIQHHVLAGASGSGGLKVTTKQAPLEVGMANLKG